MFSFPPLPQRLPRCVSSIERHTVFYLRNNISPVTKHSPTCAKQRKENETYLLRGVRSLKWILYSTWEHKWQFVIYFLFCTKHILSIATTPRLFYWHERILSCTGSTCGVYWRQSCTDLNNNEVDLICTKTCGKHFQPQTSETEWTKKGLQRFPKSVTSVNANWSSVMTNGLPFKINLFRRVFHAALKSESPRKKSGYNFEYFLNNINLFLNIFIRQIFQLKIQHKAIFIIKSF